MLLLKLLTIVQERKIVKMVNVQWREEFETRVARVVYACGISINMVRFPYWKHMVREINIAPQGFKGPNYESLQINMLKKRRNLLRMFSHLFMLPRITI